MSANTALLLRRLGLARQPALYGVSGNSPAQPRPPVPALFLKPFAGVALLRGRGKTLRLAVAPGEELRHELGLAVLIGARVDVFTPEAFAAAVAGYFLVDDVTRLAAAADSPVCNRKLLAPGTLLSALLPREAVEPLEGLRVEVAGRRERAEGVVAAQHFSLAEIAAHIARSVPLLPGDLILGGAVVQLPALARDRVEARLLRGEEELARLELRVRIETAN